MAIDSLNRVHITFGWGDSPAIVYYASNTSGNWQILNIGTGDYPSIALDSQDKVHISYCGDAGLIYATNKAGSWEKKIVTTDEGAYSSIAVDLEGYAHISYYDRKNKHLKYATNRPPE